MIDLSINVHPIPYATASDRDAALQTAMSFLRRYAHGIERAISVFAVSIDEAPFVVVVAETGRPKVDALVNNLLGHLTRTAALNIPPPHAEALDVLVLKHMELIYGVQQ